MADDAEDVAGIVVHPPLLFGGTLVAGLALSRVFPAAFLPRKIARPLGVVLFILGFVPGVVALIDRLMIAREERYLTRKFGEDYRRYCSEVRRWI